MCRQIRRLWFRFGWATNWRVQDELSAAISYLHALAVLPVDPRANNLVDGLVESRTEGTEKKRPLRKNTD